MVKKASANWMRVIALHIPEPQLQRLDKLVERKLYPNRSEAIRLAIHDLLDYEEGMTWRK